MAKPKTLCTYRGCDRPHHARGWCVAHYFQSQRNPEHMQPLHHLEHSIETRRAVVAAVEEQGLSYMEAGRRHGTSGEYVRFRVMESRAKEVVSLRDRNKALEEEIARLKARNRVLERRGRGRTSAWFEDESDGRRGQDQARV